jgi:histidinol dehydrogenase
VLRETERQLDALPRKEIARRALGNSRAIILPGTEQAMELLNAYAPEHLILACKDAGPLAEQVQNAGSVFLGHYSPETAGDYASGTNHTLPTNGYARAYSGVSVDSFMKKISFQQLSEAGLLGISSTLMEMAGAEGLQAHAAAVEIRIRSMNKQAHV